MWIGLEYKNLRLIRHITYVKLVWTDYGTVQHRTGRSQLLAPLHIYTYLYLLSNVYNHLLFSWLYVIQDSCVMTICDSSIDNS